MATSCGCSTPTAKRSASTNVAAFERASGKLRLAEPLAIEPQPGQALRAGLGRRGAGRGHPLSAGPALAASRFRRSSCGWARRAGTNALLTRRGAKTAFVTTRGFGDILRDRLSEPAAAVRTGDPQAACRCSPRSSKSTSGSRPRGEVLEAPDPN